MSDLLSPPPPDAHQLLPPLLACLPAAFVSPRPPPVLLPLLAPVLRQRINFLSGQSTAARGSWLELLSWDARPSSRLPAAVESMQLEPHPVSGEIELEGLDNTYYRRLDPETLHARLPIEQFGLLPTFVWCDSDEHGATGPGWKLADLRALDDWEDRAAWSDSISVANQMLAHHDERPTPVNDTDETIVNDMNAEAGDDDDYWAAYDREPSQTPANQAPLAINGATQDSHDRRQSDSEYFARYSDVQPAMDTHDPDEAEASAMSAGDSSLRGGLLMQQHAHVAASGQNGVAAPPMFSAQLENTHVAMPRPLSASLSADSGVHKLERQVAHEDDQAQIGVKQHISTDIKSLYRLAKSVGITRDEFTEMVARELEVLSIYDQDE